jgi:histidine ammonia-lyase
MVIAIELLAATRALDIRGDVSTEILEEARGRFRTRIPAWQEDCVLSIWMEEAASFLADAAFDIKIEDVETREAVR